MQHIDHTHNPNICSWVTSANEDNIDFPIQNLPLGIFKRKGDTNLAIGVAIGNQILDLSRMAQLRLVDREVANVISLCNGGSLNPLMEIERSMMIKIRHDIFELLSTANLDRNKLEGCLYSQKDAEMQLPARIGDFSDFSVSRHHNATLGKIAQRAAPLHPNFQYLPIAYHGRCSSIVSSGHSCRRPFGQRGLRTDIVPTFGPSEKLDYELELGLYIARSTQLGERIDLKDAEEHVFGMCLLNDWSARDLQAWEITPLGPFQGKSFMTTLSPWIITLEALAPFRTKLPPRDDDLPKLFDYFSDPAVTNFGAIEITLTASIQSQQMRDSNISPQILSTGKLAEHPWSIFQLLTQQTLNGCNLRAGDLIGTGTVSGPNEGQQACLHEISVGGTKEFALSSGELRTYLRDGDEVIFNARCQKDGYSSIGFGEARGIIVGAKQ